MYLNRTEKVINVWNILPTEEWEVPSTVCHRIKTEYKDKVM